jgi:hypothetical protein
MTKLSPTRNSQQITINHSSAITSHAIINHNKQSTSINHQQPPCPSQIETAVLGCQALLHMTVLSLASTLTQYMISYTIKRLALDGKS